MSHYAKIEYVPTADLVFGRYRVMIFDHTKTAPPFKENIVWAEDHWHAHTKSGARRLANRKIRKYDTAALKEDFSEIIKHNDLES